MSSKYDRAITVFSPDGHLFQVEYAQEAVKKGSTAVAVRGKDCVVLGVEKKAIAKLQDERTVKKIALIDDHIAMAFAGLTADARVLINRARIECKSYKLTTEVAPSVEYLANFIANLKQKYTQSNGRRPFGLSCLIVGFDIDGTPHLYQTDPSGTHFEYYANSIGKNGKSVKEFLEKTYSSDSVTNEHDTVKLTIKALLEGVQSSADHMDISLMKYSNDLKNGRNFVVYRALKTEEIEAYVQEIEKEREEEAEKKRQRKETAGISS